MSDNHNDLAREIVIVKRRRGGGDDGHHGGAWKIAYADFMTAMMAFFLVMWLVNMTDDETVVAIANYFNPLQLTDRNPSDRGLYDADPSSQGKSTSDESEQSSSEEKPRSPGRARMEKARKEKAAAQEAQLFVDPQNTLDGLAKSEDGTIPEVGTEDSLAGIDEQASPRQLSPTGPDTMDPFDPFMEKNLDPADSPHATEVRQKGNSQEGAAKTKAAKAAAAQESNEEAAETADATDAEQKKANAVDTDDASDGKESDKIAASIRSSIERAVAGLREAAPGVSVEATKEGILISLMDSEKFEMFKLSSAEPVPAAVKLIDRLGQIIVESKKKIVIRGHTDARQFKNSSYDNWRLSTARAHMAQYMLRRTGLKDGQIDKIEGFADSALRNSKDPFAPENRRIEFLLRVETP